jgi:hypothetical protein
LRNVNEYLYHPTTARLRLHRRKLLVVVFVSCAPPQRPSPSPSVREKCTKHQPVVLTDGWNLQDGRCWGTWTGLQGLASDPCEGSARETVASCSAKDHRFAEVENTRLSSLGSISKSRHPGRDHGCPCAERCDARGGNPAGWRGDLRAPRTSPHVQACSTARACGGDWP